MRKANRWDVGFLLIPDEAHRRAECLELALEQTSARQDRNLPIERCLSTLLSGLTCAYAISAKFGKAGACPRFEPTDSGY